ncbi:hypothetical protein PF008_g3312 [Phytophthora fragariae]|nr:hypothetical protein PF008_g3312 [Phytophthora fragariae]
MDGLDLAKVKEVLDISDLYSLALRSLSVALGETPSQPSRKFAVAIVGEIARPKCRANGETGKQWPPVFPITIFVFCSISRSLFIVVALSFTRRRSMLGPNRENRGPVEITGWLQLERPLAQDEYTKLVAFSVISL